MVIYEDENIIAVNKPAGLLVHKTKPGSGSSEPTLADWILKNHPAIGSVGDDPETRPGIVHRLDKETSGIMLIAKNQKTFEYLKKQFGDAAENIRGPGEKKIKKTYIALLQGRLKQNEGRIDIPIGRSGKGTRRLAHPKAKGKQRPAVTEFKVLKKFDEFTLVEARPLTGRTHQIRVHFKALGHPLACDKLYGGKPVCPGGLARHFLHASSLEFTLLGGMKLRLDASLPNDLEKALKSLN